MLALIREANETVAIQAAFALGAITFANAEHRAMVRNQEGVEALEALARRFGESPKVQQVTQYALRHVNEPVKDTKVPVVEPSPPTPKGKK